VTGVPCPLCGLTTSVEAIIRGNGHTASTANPFGWIAVAFAVALLVRPRWRQVSLPTAMVLAGVALSWLFELHRYHLL
jgi:ABC-type Fe3+-siderophore transport system permease subunit